MTLPNKETSDIQLNDWGNKHIKGFKGVINRNDFYKYAPNMKNGDSIIINLDPHYKHQGTHWVALRYSTEAPNNLVFYKDSFGAPPPDNIIKDVNESGRKIIYGSNIFQKPKQQNCGKRSCYFLRDMSIASDNYCELEYFENLEK